MKWSAENGLDICNVFFRFHHFVHCFNHLMYLFIVFIWLSFTKFSDKWCATQYNGGRTGIGLPNLLTELLLSSWVILIYYCCSHLHVCLLDDELFLGMLENQQVEQAHAGINALALSQETINKLRENFIDIDK